MFRAGSCILEVKLLTLGLHVRLHISPVRYRLTGSRRLHYRGRRVSRYQTEYKRVRMKLVYSPTPFTHHNIPDRNAGAYRDSWPSTPQFTAELVARRASASLRDFAACAAQTGSTCPLSFFLKLMVIRLQEDGSSLETFVAL